MSEASIYEGIGGVESADALYKGIFSGALNHKQISHIIREFKPQSRKRMDLISRLITRSLFPPTFSKIGEDAIPRWVVDYIDTYIERNMRSVKDREYRWLS